MILKKPHLYIKCFCCFNTKFKIDLMALNNFFM